MTIILLGKKLEDYPNTEYEEENIIYSEFDYFKKHNIKAIRKRLDDNFKREVFNLFVMSGNNLKTTNKIIAKVRVIKSFGILTEDEWDKAIPIIERGFKANKSYVKMLDEISPIFERYCKEYDDVNMRHTFSERIGLELWQGRFSEHSENPNKEPEYT